MCARPTVHPPRLVFLFPRPVFPARRPLSGGQRSRRQKTVHLKWNVRRLKLSAGGSRVFFWNRRPLSPDWQRWCRKTERTPARGGFQRNWKRAERAGRSGTPDRRCRRGCDAVGAARRSPYNTGAIKSLMRGDPAALSTKEYYCEICEARNQRATRNGATVVPPPVHLRHTRLRDPSANGTPGNRSGKVK